MPQRPVPQRPVQPAPQQAPPQKPPEDSGEKVLAKVYGTRFTYLKWYFGAVIVFIISAILILGLLPETPGVVDMVSAMEPYRLYFFGLIPLGILLIAVGELKLRYERYYLTNRRIRHLKGYVGTNETDIEYEMISHYSMTQSFLERIMNHGTIRIETVAGGKTAQLCLRMIPKAKKIKAIIDERVSAAKGPYMSRR